MLTGDHDSSGNRPLAVGVTMGMVKLTAPCLSTMHRHCLWAIITESVFVACSQGSRTSEAPEMTVY